MSTTGKLKVKERNAIMQALKSGVVPRIGLHHIQVGRDRELVEIIGDIERVADGGSAIRFVTGDYGAGKTFFLHLTRLIALKKGLVVMYGDLAPDRRLHATQGQARGLFSELTKNCSTQSKPDGGALKAIVERFIDKTKKEALKNGQPVSVAIRAKLEELSDLVSGYHFSEAVDIYYRAYEDGDNVRQNNALRWLRGEYNSKMEARAELGMRSIIDDANFYDYLKLYSRFAQLAGYKGLLVSLDELVNLYKLQSSQARKNNYEQVLRILNDVLQGSVEGFGILFGATPQFIEDDRRGLYSYEALQSRLASNPFAKNGMVDLSGPVMSLNKLSEENLFVLLEKIATVFAKGDQENTPIDAEKLKSFMRHCQKGVGASYFQTPRNTVKSFVHLLSVLEQNPDAKWDNLVGAVQLGKDVNKDQLELPAEENAHDAELVSFQL